MNQNSVLGGPRERGPVRSRRAFGAVAAVYCACEAATGAKRRREPTGAKRRREPSREAAAENALLSLALPMRNRVSHSQDSPAMLADRHCTFCDLIHGAGEVSICYEDADAIAFMDIQPVNTGHVLVVSRRHYENLEDVPDELAMHLFRV